MVTLFSANNVHVAAAPPAYFTPNANGFPLPAGLTSWLMTIVSSGFAPGSAANIAVEYLYGSTWTQVAETGGFALGPYACDGGGITDVSNTQNPTITTMDTHGLSVGQQITISGVQGATRVNGTFTVRSVPNSITFTITLAAPGVYTGGGSVVTSTNFLSSNLLMFGQPYPSRGRLRLDAIAAGTLDSVTLTAT